MSAIKVSVTDVDAAIAASIPAIPVMDSSEYAVINDSGIAVSRKLASISMARLAAERLSDLTGERYRVVAAIHTYHNGALVFEGYSEDFDHDDNRVAVDGVTTFDVCVVGKTLAKGVSMKEAEDAVYQYLVNNGNLLEVLDTLTFISHFSPVNSAPVPTPTANDWRSAENHKRTVRMAKWDAKSTEITITGNVSDPAILARDGFIVIDMRTNERLFAGTRDAVTQYIVQLASHRGNHVNDYRTVRYAADKLRNEPENLRRVYRDGKFLVSGPDKDIRRYLSQSGFDLTGIVVSAKD